jgi:hypothetical protein
LKQGFHRIEKLIDHLNDEKQYDDDSRQVCHHGLILSAALVSTIFNTATIIPIAAILKMMSTLIHSEFSSQVA